MRSDPSKNLNAIDRITLLYLFTTTIFIGLAWNNLENKLLPLVFRILAILIIYGMGYFHELFRGGVIQFLRYAYPLVLIVYLYPETDHFNNIFFENQDPFFSRVEETIFGFQPALRFLDRFHELWIIELMSFGYFSYYLLIFGFTLLLFLTDQQLFYRLTFVMISSFYVYYLVFILLPVAGPQYFFPPPENEVPEAYLFSSMLKLVQELGERPTGAFPSSHAGIALIIIWYTWKYRRYWLSIILPLSILLIASTVYIKAHYVIDVIAALVTVPFFILSGNSLFHLLNKQKQTGWESTQEGENNIKPQRAQNK